MSRLADNPLLRLWLAVVLLVALMLGAQALAAATAPPGGVAATGRVLGQTGFAYVGGIRTFAAAILWNRIDPLFHNYYGEQLDKSFEVFLPTTRIILALDPHFDQAYYVAAFVLARNQRIDSALELAQEGIRNNPKSGLLRASYVQVMLLQNKTGNLPDMLEQARIGTGPGMTWATPDDQFEAYGVFAAVYELAGDNASAAALRQAQDALGRPAGPAPLGGDSDRSEPGTQ